MKRVGRAVLCGLCGTAFASGRDTDATLLARYVLTAPAQVRDLRVTGSEFQETRLTLRFYTAAPVRFPAGENLHAESAAQAREFARSSPCADDLKSQSAVRLWRMPKVATSIGRLVMNTRQQYCVFIWNTDF